MRLSNIELLRIILMLMIITHHVLVGLGLKKNSENVFNYDELVFFELSLNSFVVIGVNTFVIISGFFGINFKRKTLYLFMSQALFYSIFFFIISCIVDFKSFSLRRFLEAFLPLSRNVWWFFTTYCALYILSPFINKGIDNIQKKDYFILLVFLIYMNCFSGFLFGVLNTNSGYSIFHFIVLYLGGRYLGKFNIKFSFPLLGLVFFVIVMIVLIFAFSYFGRYDKIWKLYSYNNPLIVLSSMCMFFVFFNLYVSKYKIIHVLSSSIFGVYLIHNHSFASKYINEILSLMRLQNVVNVGVFVLKLCGVVLVIFLFSSFIELGRKYLCRNLEDKIYEKMSFLKYKVNEIIYEK